MPRYDYQCQKCANIFEITRSISDNSDVFCQKCESKDTKKLISIPAITFRGGGFYKTDNKGGMLSSKIEKKVETATIPIVEKKLEKNVDSKLIND